MDRLSTDDTQLNSMAVAEQENQLAAEAADYYFQMTVLMSDTPLPEFDREEFEPGPTEIAIIAGEPSSVAMLDPGSGEIVVQASDFFYFDSVAIDGATGQASEAIPASNPGELVGSTSAVAAGIGDAIPIPIPGVDL